MNDHIEHRSPNHDHEEGEDLATARGVFIGTIFGGTIWLLAVLGLTWLVNCIQGQA